MKKISLLMALPLAMSACLTSCVEDTQPRLETPTEFVLNTPPMAGETYVFRADEEYKNLNDITLTVSQPNYGVGVVPTYYVQLSKSEEGFKAWSLAMAEATDNGEELDPNKVLDAEGLPIAYALNLSTQQAVIQIDGSLFCDGVNALYGIDADNYSPDPLPVAVRVHAVLPNAPQSEIWSNVINLKVSTYVPVKEPGKLYLIGKPGGWDINSDKLVLNETGIATKIYYGNVFIPADEFTFRFYSQLGDWESYSIGSQDEDKAIDIAFNSEGLYEGSVSMSTAVGDKNGKGSWNVADWPGGNVEITVNLKDMTITMKKSEGKKIYAIGNFQGWDINKDNCALLETPAGSNIYEGTFDIADPSAGVEFALYTALGDWESNFLGPEEGKENFSVAAGPYIGTIQDRKANFKCESWSAAQMKVTADLNSYTITIEGI